MSYRDYFQAGKSVAGIHEIVSTKEIIVQITSMKS